VPEAAVEAVEKYREFHRLEPKKIGEFPAGFQIPPALCVAGRARWVTYRSGKVDPESLRKPRGTIDYIHEHDAGVMAYLKPELARAQLERVTQVQVPPQFRDVPALARLGACLGFCFEEEGDKQEVEATLPLPDLYTVPDGKCLLVIQSQQTVLAMMWGGALGVFARGIDG
jgi:hypothetical protein